MNKTTQFLQNILSRGAYNPSLGVYQGQKSSGSNKNKKNTSNTKAQSTYSVNSKTVDDSASFQDRYNEFMRLMGGSGGGGGASAQRINLNPIIQSYRAQGAAQKKSISDSFANERNLLAQYLENAQKNAERNRQLQSEAFNSARADLEEQAFMNTRAAQQSASARGLGGSGLQQLAQLSNQIESSEQTSDLAKSNTEAQESISDALKEYQKEIETKTSDLNEEEKNALTEIDATIGNAIANLQYQEEVRYQEALAAAAATNANLNNSIKQAALEYAMGGAQLEPLNNALKINMNDAIEEFNNTVNNKKYSDKELKESLKSVYNNYKGLFQAALSETDGTNEFNDLYNYYSNQLKGLYDYYKENGKNAKVGYYNIGV